VTLKRMPTAIFADRPAFVLTEREIEWRRLRTSRLGADAELAAEIAASNIDVHSLEWLLKTGCPLDLAWRILS
jgi:hypothetical protein